MDLTAAVIGTEEYLGGSVGALNQPTRIRLDFPRCPFSGSLRCGQHCDQRVAESFRIVEKQDLIRLRCATHRYADIDFFVLGVYLNPETLSVLPIYGIPSGLDFLRQLRRFAPVEKVEPRSTCDHHPLF